MKTLRNIISLLLSLLVFISCKDSIPQPFQEVNAKVGEPFMISAPSRVYFTNLENIQLEINIDKFDRWIVRGLVSRRTYTTFKISGDDSKSFQVETGLDKDTNDACLNQGEAYCNEVPFEIKGQQFLLKFNDVYWSDKKTNSEGIEYHEVDSAQLILLKN
jgi:hypothetical protein